MRAFASDNYAPALPEALDAIAAVNPGHAVSYGADVNGAARRPFREHFGADAVGFPVFNGTGGERRRPAGDAPPVAGSDLRGERAPQRR